MVELNNGFIDFWHKDRKKWAERSIWASKEENGHDGFWSILAKSKSTWALEKEVKQNRVLNRFYILGKET
jgi:hypothetical protein